VAHVHIDGGIREGQNLLKGLPVDAVPAADGSLAPTVDEDATADVGYARSVDPRSERVISAATTSLRPPPDTSRRRSRTQAIRQGDYPKFVHLMQARQV
jgi:hypothetical protein